MTSFEWSSIEIAARLLRFDEREAILGDLLETDGNVWQGLNDLAGLLIRRQAAHWKDWQPWLAAFGLALPGSLLLMGVSISVISMYQRLLSHGIISDSLLTVHDGLLPLMCLVVLLIAWSWTGGFVVGALSRRTLWVSAVLSLFPIVFCFARFRVESMSRLCLLLFLLPAILGVRQGLRMVRIRPGSATALAVAVTMLMISTWNRDFWTYNLMLIWPAWYIVATAQRRREKEETSS